MGWGKKVEFSAHPSAKLMTKKRGEQEKVQTQKRRARSRGVLHRLVAQEGAPAEKKEGVGETGV